MLFTLCMGISLRGLIVCSVEVLWLVHHALVLLQSLAWPVKPDAAGSTAVHSSTLLPLCTAPLLYSSLCLHMGTDSSCPACVCCVPAVDVQR